MMGVTHKEGGRTAVMLTAIASYFFYPYGHIDLLLLSIATILIVNCCNFAATMKDLDQNEQAMPSRGLFSYIFHCIIYKFDRKHRSIFSHCITLDIVMWLVPLAYLHWDVVYSTISNKINSYSSLSSTIALVNSYLPAKGVDLNNIEKLNSVINFSPEYLFLIEVVLLSMFFGNFMHLVLDRFTVEGVCKWYGIFVLIYYKIKGRDVNKVRRDLFTTLIHKKHSKVLSLNYPFIKEIEVDDYGKTGGEYEKQFNKSLITFNNLAVGCAFIVVLAHPDMYRIFNFILSLFKSI